MKKRALVAAYKFGFDREIIKLYDKIKDIGWGKLKIDKQIREYELSENNWKGDVLFNLIPAYKSFLYQSGALGHAFRTRGYRPIFLYDDIDLPRRPEFTIDNTPPWKPIRYRYEAEQFFETFGFESVAIGDIVDAGNYDRLAQHFLDDLTYRGIPLSSAAKASTRKYLKRYSLDFSDSETRKIYQDFFRGAGMLVDSSKYILDEYDIKATITKESNYINGFVPLAVSRRAAVPTYSSNWGYRDGQLMFGNATNRNHMNQFAARSVVEAALSSDLTAEEREAVETVISRWRNNEIASIDYANRTGTSINTDKEYLVGLFTNLLWDGSLEPDQALYGDVYDWLQDSISIFSQKEDTRLVIKPHPAEHLRGTTEKVGDWIQKEYDELPENITLLSSDTDIDTYELFNDIDLGIVYASTVGLEIVCDGVPVITAGYPPYHGFDITYDPDTKSAYKQLIKNPTKKECTRYRQDRARRYYHFLFFCKHFEFPYHSGSNVLQGEVTTNTINHDELTPGNEPWDSIIEQILNNEEVIHPRCQQLKQ